MKKRFYLVCSLPVIKLYPKQICQIADEKLQTIIPVPAHPIPMMFTALMSSFLSKGPTTSPEMFITTTFSAMIKVMAVARPSAKFLRRSPNIRP